VSRSKNPVPSEPDTSPGPVLEEATPAAGRPRYQLPHPLLYISHDALFLKVGTLVHILVLRPSLIMAKPPIMGNSNSNNQRIHGLKMAIWQNLTLIPIREAAPKDNHLFLLYQRDEVDPKPLVRHIFSKVFLSDAEFNFEGNTQATMDVGSSQGF
jgi:hypothetical protein